MYKARKLTKNEEMLLKELKEILTDAKQCSGGTRAEHCYHEAGRVPDVGRGSDCFRGAGGGNGMKEAERCCVCGRQFGWVDFLTGKSVRMLNRNGKHICNECHKKYLAELAMHGNKDGENEGI